MKFVCDLETTGLDPIRNDIIEICLLAVNEENNIVGEFHRQVCPEVINALTWSRVAEAVHGYTPEQASEFPPRRKVLLELLHFLEPFKCQVNTPREFICHALPERIGKGWPYFDYYFLEWAFRKEKWEYSFWKVFSPQKITSTITMARTFSGNHKGHKLNKWAKHIGFDLNHHEAKSDAYACLELYKYFLKNAAV